ncbi:MAG: dTDP-4-keto-6-deoxy-D-glucose epimerase [Chitinophagia bacterium]|nr:dTDP-4-keto-6-deoxy-D-glucose epimerase [Chitinophagia bacterium]
MQTLPLTDALLIQMPNSADDRGYFVKTFHHDSFAKLGIDFGLRESYYSLSKQDVIRGMHFQLPPHHHAKIVFCAAGAILDVIVDLRRASPTYGQHYATVLSSANRLAYYIPEGFAHGFKSLEDNTLTYYLVTSVYYKESDTGIRYDSIGFNWEVENPMVSARDMGFTTLSRFESPF